MPKSKWTKHPSYLNKIISDGGHPLKYFDRNNLNIQHVGFLILQTATITKIISSLKFLTKTLTFTIIRRWLGHKTSHVDSGLMSEFGKITFHALIRFHVENQASPVPEAVRLKFSVSFRLNTTYRYRLLVAVFECDALRIENANTFNHHVSCVLPAFMSCASLPLS